MKLRDKAPHAFGFRKARDLLLLGFVVGKVLDVEALMVLFPAQANAPTFF
jgi:hypothetical protein